MKTWADAVNNSRYKTGQDPGALNSPTWQAVGFVGTEETLEVDVGVLWEQLEAQSCDFDRQESMVQNGLDEQDFSNERPQVELTKMPSELRKRMELQECMAKNELLEQKLREVEGKLEQVETIKCNLNLQVTALSSNLGQAEARISRLRLQIEDFAREEEVAGVKRRALEKANKYLTTQCNDARTEKRALHHQIGDLTAQKQEADQRVCEIQAEMDRILARPAYMEPAGLLDHTGRKRRRTGPNHEAAERIVEALYAAQKSEEFHRSRCMQLENANRVLREEIHAAWKRNVGLREKVGEQQKAQEAMQGPEGQRPCTEQLGRQLKRRLTEEVAEKVTDSGAWQLACERQAKEDALQREARLRMLYMAAQQENVQLSREKLAAELEKQAAEREKEAAEHEKLAAEHEKEAAEREKLAAERALQEQSALRAATQQEAAQDRTETVPELDASAETQVNRGVLPLVMTLPAWMLQHLSGACQRLTHSLQPFQGLSMALCLAAADRLAWLQMAGVGVDRNGPAHVLGLPLPGLPTLNALHNLLLPIRPQPSEGQQPAAATPLDRQSGPPPATEAPAEALPAPSAPSAASSPTQAQAEAGSNSSELSDSAPLETGSPAAAAPCAPFASTQGGLRTSAIVAGVGCFAFGISASSAVARTAVSAAVWPLWASARTARCLVPI